MKYLLVSMIFVLSLEYARADNEGKDSISQITADDDSDMYMEPMEPQIQATSIEEQQNSQNSFYPSFAQPLGHSRPFYFQQEGAFSQRAQPHYQQVFDEPVRYNGFKEEYASPSSSAATEDILGSGNFGVIRGGIFNNDNEGQQTSYGDYSSYFHNGHGRPSFYFGKPPNPKPYKHEQFANFKDFADINTPTDRQYSQYVVVYVNKNDTEDGGIKQAPEKIKHKPKNIIESLELLDLESSTTTEEIPEKKLSNSKRKLAMLLPEKKHKIKLMNKENVLKDLNEPLLALS